MSIVFLLVVHTSPKGIRRHPFHSCLPKKSLATRFWSPGLAASTGKIIRPSRLTSGAVGKSLAHGKRLIAVLKWFAIWSILELFSNLTKSASSLTAKADQHADLGAARKIDPTRPRTGPCGASLQPLISKPFPENLFSKAKGPRGVLLGRWSCEKGKDG